MEDLVKKALDLVCINLSQNNFEEAELICDQILKVDTKNLFAQYLYSECLKKQGRKSNPPKSESSDFFSELGMLFLNSKLNNEAMEYFFESLFLNPKNSQAWCGLAGFYKKKNMFWTAERLLKKSLKYNKNEQTWVNLARMYGERRLMKKAIRCLRKALEINENCVAAKIDLASILFLIGKWKEPGRLYRSRYEYFPNLKEINSVFPQERMWDGRKIEKKKITFFSEQGVGDTFNFIRFVKAFEQKFPNNEINVVVPNSTRDFIQKQGFKVTDKLEDYDFCCSIMDLPWLLSLKKKDVVSKKAFKTERVCDFSHFKDKFKIGICWAGSPANPRDKHRSCRLDLFRQIYQIPNVKLFSLQFDLRTRIWPDQSEPVDLTENCSDMKIVNMQPHMKTWDDTAAIISGLDLVISVDTSVMHLSASLNKKTLGLIAYLPDWRWGLKSNNTIWYSSLELFRQEEIGDWNKPFEKIKQKINDLIR